MLFTFTLTNFTILLTPFLTVNVFNLKKFPSQKGFLSLSKNKDLNVGLNLTPCAIFLIYLSVFYGISPRNELEILVLGISKTMRYCYLHRKRYSNTFTYLCATTKTQLKQRGIWLETSIRIHEALWQPRLFLVAGLRTWAK